MSSVASIQCFWVTDCAEEMYVYKSSRCDVGEDLQMLEELLTESFDGSEDTFIHYTEAHYREEIAQYLTIIYMLLLSSLFCCVFLSMILTETKGYEMYLKRVLGFSKIRMVIDVGRQLLVPEFYALGVAGIFTLVAESVQGKASIWVKNVIEGFAPVSLVFILLGITMAMIPCMMLKKKPAEALKYSE